MNNNFKKILFNIILVLLIFILIVKLFNLNNNDENSKNIKESFKNNENTQNKKIALCFLIYDKINHEKLWYNWLSNVDPNKYTIYIHYKENKPLKYFEKYKLIENIQTKWCGISIVKVQNLILKKALKDTNNQHFIWLSQACIPLKTFDNVYNFLNPQKSYFNKSPDSQVLNMKIEGLKYIKKAAMPSILNRKHSSILVQNENMIDLFKDVNVCKEEITYLSLLYNFGLENELELTPNLSSNAIIFTGWPDMSNYKKFEGSTLIKNSPNAYTHISEEELEYLINSKSLFGRKFEENCGGLENLLDLIK